MQAAETTIECHRARLAELAALKRERPAHKLNDRLVQVAQGAVATSIYKSGSNYTPGCALLVIAVLDGRAMVAGPRGPATIDAASLTTEV